GRLRRAARHHEAGQEDSRLNASLRDLERGGTGRDPVRPARAAAPGGLRGSRRAPFVANARMAGMNEAWGELSIQDAYAEAARTFVSLVRAIPAGSWDGPGLGEWDLRSLVGHTSRSLITVETYLSKPAEREDVPSPEAYYS